MSWIRPLSMLARALLSIAVSLLTAGAPGFVTAVHGQPATPAPAATRPAFDTLTLGQVVDRVLRDNPGLAALRSEKTIARALAEQASLRPNPTISYEHQRVPQANRAYSAGVSLPIELFGQRDARISAADRATLATLTEIDKAEAELRGQAIHAFFEVLTAQERVELALATNDLATRFADVAQRRVLAGRVSPVEEQRARVAQGVSQVELIQAQSMLQTARSQLAALWGDSAVGSYVLTPPDDALIGVPAAGMIEQRLHDAPVLRRARAEIEHRRSQIELAKAQARPSTAISVGTGTLVETGQRSNTIGLSVTIPLFDRQQGNIEAARIRASQASLQLAATELTLRTEVDQAVARLTAARQQLDLARNQIVPQATQTLEASTRGYELGRFSLLDVFDAQRALFTARAQLRSALGDAYQAAADLERLLGPAPMRSATPPDVDRPGSLPPPSSSSTTRLAP